MIERLLLIILAVLLPIFSSYGNKEVIFGQGKETLPFAAKVQVLEDFTHQLSINDIIQSDSFKKNEDDIINLGVSDATIWLKFTLKNQSPHQNLILELANPTIDEATLFTVWGEAMDSTTISDSQPFDQRKYHYPNCLFDLPAQQGRAIRYFIRIKSKERKLIPLRVGESKAIIYDNEDYGVLHGMYLGIILVMFFYNLFIYFSTRDRIYFFYIMHALLAGLTYSSFQGYGFQYLWPDSIWLAQHGIFIFTSLFIVSGIAFFVEILRVKLFIPQWYKWSYALGLLGMICFVLSLFKITYFLYHIIQVSSIVVIVCSIVATVFVIRKEDYRPAKFYLLALICLCLSVFTYYIISDSAIISNLGSLTYSSYVVLLSLVLTDRINVLRQEKEEAQTKLIEADKLASLGLLLSGVAHEIKNPIHYTQLSVQLLKEYIDGLLTKLEYYKSKEPELSAEQLEGINKLKKEIEVDYLVDEVKELLKGLEDGSMKTIEIVKSLNQYVRTDQEIKGEADINASLDATLILLSNKINTNISVVKNYEALPNTHVYLGKLNQLFVNVLNNAIEAIGDEKGGQITIHTFQEKDHVCVSIKDNGVGIPIDIQKRIFEPFFTTKKSIGAKGLGLSIGLGIIEQHEGDIKISVAKEETEVLISLPIVVSHYDKNDQLKKVVA